MASQLIAHLRVVVFQELCKTPHGPCHDRDSDRPLSRTSWYEFGGCAAVGTMSQWANLMHPSESTSKYISIALNGSRTSRRTRFAFRLCSESHGDFCRDDRSWSISSPSRPFWSRDNVSRACIPSGLIKITAKRVLTFVI